MKNTYLLLLVFSLICLQNITAQLDSDSDGMPDDWELKYNLNPNDAKDALEDKDGDHVYNLYEYQLGTSPLNEFEPTTLVYDGVGTLIDFIRKAPSHHRIIIPEGNYNLSINLFLGVASPLMIQGGWSSDMSSYNPYEFKTVLDGANEKSTFSIGFHEEGQSFIIDGFKVTQGKNSVRGAVDLVGGDIKQLNLSISNCSFVHNETNAGLRFYMFKKTSADVLIVNNLIYGNKKHGILAYGGEFSKSNYKIYNNTCVNNKMNSFFGGGIGINAKDSAQIKVDLKNNICFNNDKKDLDVEGSIKSGTSSILIAGSHNMINKINARQDPSIKLTSPIKGVPEFIDALKDDYTPAIGGSLVDAGIDVGLYYFGKSPDLGAIELELKTGSNNAISNRVRIFPNPVNDIVKIDSKVPIQKIEIYGLNGYKIATIYNNIFATKDLIPGQYVIIIHTKNHIETQHFIKY